MKKEVKTVIEKKINKLKREKNKILSLSPEEAFQEIIDSENSLPLVHLLKEEELHILINEIGAEDCLELLKMASSNQLNYIFDIEIWEKDKINLPASVKWLMHLFQADQARLIKWIFEEDPEEKIPFLEYILNKTINVIIREEDEDPSDFEDGFFTFDDAFYIKSNMPFSFLNIKKEEDPEIPAEDDVIEADINENPQDFFYFFLQKIALYDVQAFRSIIMSQRIVIPSEYEEEALRLKNVRLAEKGFAPYETAIGIYQALNYNDLKKTIKKQIKPKYENFLPSPVFYTDYSNQENLFTKALKNMDISERYNFQSEFACLCNHIISADQKIIKSRGDLKKIVIKASNYISIGLETAFSHDKNKKKSTIENYAISLMQKYLLENIFRIGSGAVFKLKWKTEKFIKNSWFMKEKLALYFWDEDFTGVIGGVLLTKPLFFDNYENGVLYREFENLEDIDVIDNKINKILCFDTLFKKLNLKSEIEAEAGLNTFITYKNLLLSFWAKSFFDKDAVQNDTNKLIPLSFKEIKSFFKKLFYEGKPRKVDDNMKNAFLSWASLRSNIDIHIISEKFGAVLEELFIELEDEYKTLEYDKIDPNYLVMFLIYSNQD
jgi:hypothetical protein